MVAPPKTQRRCRVTGCSDWAEKGPYYRGLCPEHWTLPPASLSGDNQ